MKAIKKVLFLSIIAFTFSKKINAQTSNYNPKEYSNSNRKLVFEENFDDDKNKWLDKDDSTNNGTVDTAFIESKETKIVNGHLKYDNQSRSKIYAAGLKTNIDFNKNFEIEINAIIFFALKPHDPSTVIFWGRDSTYNCTYLYYDESQFLSLIVCKDFTDCKAKSKHSKDFVKNDFNKITIRHYNDSYYIFINEKFQKAFPFRSLTGDRIGLGAGVQCTMVYDYIKIYYLN